MGGAASGLRSPGAGKSPTGAFSDPPSDSLPLKAIKTATHKGWMFIMELVMGVYALAAGSWPNRLALPLANAPRGREKAPLGLFLIRPPTTFH